VALIWNNLSRIVALELNLIQKKFEK